MILLAALLPLVLAGCETRPLGPLGFDGVGMAPPPGLAVLPGGVDGLVVGDRLMDAGEYELALRAYLRAAAENGSSPELVTALGSANLRLGRLGQAERLLRQAVELEPRFVPAWNNLGVVLMEQGQYGEARGVFRQAFALDSGQSDQIRENLRLAIARQENAGLITPDEAAQFELVRHGGGLYVLADAP